MRSRRRWANIFRLDSVFAWCRSFEMDGVQYEPGGALPDSLRSNEGMLRDFWIARYLDFVDADGRFLYSPGLVIPLSADVMAQFGVVAEPDGEAAGNTTDLSGGDDPAAGGAENGENGDSGGDDPPADPAQATAGGDDTAAETETPAKPKPANGRRRKKAASE